MRRGKKKRKRERNSAQVRHGKWRNSSLFVQGGGASCSGSRYFKIAMYFRLRVRIKILGVPRNEWNVTISRNKPSVLSRRSSVNHREATFNRVQNNS